MARPASDTTKRINALEATVEKQKARIKELESALTATCIVAGRVDARCTCGGSHELAMIYSYVSD